MPKMKCDKNKMKEGRCRGHNEDYIPWIKANEAKSIATASIVWDPIAKRPVHLLSRGEECFYWQLRFDPNVLEIREQYAMFDTKRVKRICKEFESYRGPSVITSTDFLVDYIDGSTVAYSVKYKRSETEESFFLKREKYQNFLYRQFMEKKYWEEEGTIFKLIFSDELNQVLSENISNVMLYFDRSSVHNDSTLFLHYIANHLIDVPMDHEILFFPDLLKDPQYYAQFLEVKAYDY